MNEGGAAEAETWIGRSVERSEDGALLSGRARFMDDLEPVAGLRHAAILRSPHAHARILRIDTSAATAMEGCIGVITGADIAGGERCLQRDNIMGSEGIVGERASPHSSILGVAIPNEHRLRCYRSAVDHNGQAHLVGCAFTPDHVPSRCVLQRGQLRSQ